MFVMASGARSFRELLQPKCPPPSGLDAGRCVGIVIVIATVAEHFDLDDRRQFNRRGRRRSIAMVGLHGRSLHGCPPGAGRVGKPGDVGRNDGGDAGRFCPRR